MLHADESLFHTGWFVESLATQVLVIFVIRTKQSPLRSRANRWLAASSLGIVLLAFLLPLSPLAAPLGLVRLPFRFLPILGVLVAAYLVSAELAKQWFYRRMTPR